MRLAVRLCSLARAFSGAVLPCIDLYSSDFDLLTEAPQAPRRSLNLAVRNREAILSARVDLCIKQGSLTLMQSG